MLPEQETLESPIESYAVGDNVYVDLTVSTSEWLPVLQGLVYSLDYEQSYVAYAVNSYTFKFVAGARDSFQYTAVLGYGTISCSSVDYIATYSFDPNGTSAPSLSYTSGSFSLPVTNQLVFAEVGPFPHLVERSVSDATQGTFYVVLIAGMFYFLTRLRASVGH